MRLAKFSAPGLIRTGQEWVSFYKVSAAQVGETNHAFCPQRPYGSTPEVEPRQAKLPSRQGGGSESGNIGEKK